MKISKPAENVFFEALAKNSAEDRAAFLKSACSQDAELQDCVARLLSALPSADASSVSQSVIPGKKVPPTHNHVGTVIAGRYTLQEAIGTGGMGSVFRANQTEPVQREVAIKLIRTEMASQQVLARFDAERQALALMDHPNIAKVLDAGATASGQPYFVMELVKGTPITEYCDQHRMTLRDRLALFIPVCQAIQHAHQKGIIHRDIKPNNILVGTYDDRPIPKVIDFGIAKSTEGQLAGLTYHTVSGSLVGTPEYMSPEQAKLQDTDIDTRSDVYSLGVVLYELLTGTTPLKSTTTDKTPVLEKLRAVREDDPVSPSQRLKSTATLADVANFRGTAPTNLTQTVSGELDWIVMKALDKDRTRRYESAGEFAKDIQRFLNNEPVEAGPESVSYRVSKFVHRHRAAVFTAGGIACLLLAAVAISSWLAYRATKAEKLASDRLQAVESANEKTTKALEDSERSRKMASDEAAIATAINDFFNVDLLGQADIRNQFNVPDRDAAVTVRTLLDRASAEIEGKFAGQELTEAAIRLTMARAYLGLGLPADSLPHAQRSVDLYEKNNRASHPTTLRAMNHLALALQGLGRFPEAEQSFRKAIAGWQDASDKDPVTRLVTMQNLGLMFEDQTRYADAKKQLKLVLDQCREQLGESHQVTRNVRMNVANINRLLGHYAEAEPIIRQEAEYQSRSLGSDHPNALQCSLALASLLQARGQLNEAAQIFNNVHETAQKKLGPDHRVTLTAANNLAMLEIARGRFGPAENLLRPAMERCTAKFGGEHPLTIDMKSNYAGVLVARGRFDDAEKMLLQVLPLSQTKLGPAHETTNLNTANLAQVYSRLGRHAEAEPLLLKAYEVANTKLGPDHAGTLTSLNNWGIHLMNRGRFEEAEAALRKVIDARRDKLGPDHSQTLVAMNNLGFLCRECKRIDEAEALFTETVQRSTAKLGEQHATTLQSMNNLASVYLNRGRLADAEPLFTKTLENARQTFGPSHPRTATTAFNLALVYYGGKRFDEAEPLFRDALASCRSVYGSDHAETVRVMARLAEMYRQTKRYADVTPLLRECLKYRETRKLDDWGTANLKVMLGEAFLEQNKHDEAEPLLIQGYEGLLRHEKQIPKELANRLNEAMQGLVGLYEKWGKPEDAAKWQEQLNQRQKAQPK